MRQQLSLAVQLPDDETFASFISGPNTQLVQHLKTLAGGLASRQQWLTYFSGEQGTGKSHLMFALCHAAHHFGYRSQYISFGQKDELEISVLERAETNDFLCLDDVEKLSGDPLWQEALFDLINRAREKQQCHLIISGNSGPTQLDIELADLRSRLAWGVSYQLLALSDDERLLALQKRAQQRGLNLTDEVGRFLLHHWRRDMPALMEVLEKLDRLSLQEQRRLTIPFVKQALAI